MMSELTRLRDEAARLSETYRMYKDSEDPAFRRRAHLELDKFLMEHRETAIICMEQMLTQEIEGLKEHNKANIKTKTRQSFIPSWFRRGGAKPNGTTRDA